MIVLVGLVKLSAFYIGIVERQKGDSTVVEHLTHIPKVEGFSPAAGTGSDRMAGKCF